MTVLLQYNVATVWTVAQLAQTTGIQIEYLLRVLEVLIKKKLLLSDEEQLELQQPKAAVEYQRTSKTGTEPGAGNPPAASWTEQVLGHSSCHLAHHVSVQTTGTTNFGV